MYNNKNHVLKKYAKIIGIISIIMTIYETIIIEIYFINVFIITSPVLI